MDSSSDIVELNVGGRIFTTTKSTLVASSYFEVMFSGKMQPGARDKEGRIFIDRNPDKFYWVLEWLRCDQQELPSDFSRKALKNELCYYGVPYTCDIIEQKPSKRQRIGRNGAFSSEPGYQALVKAVLECKDALKEGDSRQCRWIVLDQEQQDEDEHSPFHVAVDTFSYNAFRNYVTKQDVYDGIILRFPRKKYETKLAAMLYQDTGLVSVSIDSEMISDFTIPIDGQFPS